jgi:RNA-directed DNA polymerase
MKSKSAKVLAVPRVTQDNQGKKTAGIDGVKSLTPQKRLELVDQLRLTDKAKPVRRVWIDQPTKTEKRPLGIPTMNDRATQALVKAALQPEWEAKFEPDSATDFDPDAHVTMPLKQYLLQSGLSPNTY